MLEPLQDSEIAEQRKLLKMRENEIAELKDELFNAKRQVQFQSNQELSEKNRQIEKLSNLVKNLQTGRDSFTAYQNRLSLEQLSESFNELKFQQAMEEKKKSQEIIDHLMKELIEVANTSTKEHFTQLQTQMAIVVEKQEVADNALGKCAEICVCTLDHLHELANFLRALLQQKEFKESMNETTMNSIKSLLDSTMDFSNQASRYSVDGCLSLPNISSLDILMTSARVSIANIRDIQNANKSIQASYDDKQDELEREFHALKREMEEANRVNNSLHDNINQLKQSIENYKLNVETSDTRIEELKVEKDNLNRQLQEAENFIEELTLNATALEKQLIVEAEEKSEIQAKFVTIESLAVELKEKLDNLAEDLEKNWVTKDIHESTVQRLNDDIVNGEAQVAAIRMEMDSLRVNLVENVAQFLIPSWRK
jgi:DNA repair exonuclease SbcCD ATPase subunit